MKPKNSRSVGRGVTLHGSSRTLILQERLKREYKLANKRREGYIDESEEDEDESQLSKDGKSLKKLMHKLEKNVAYESDEERNPYASSVSPSLPATLTHTGLIVY